MISLPPKSAADDSHLDSLSVKNPAVRRRSVQFELIPRQIIFIAEDKNLSRQDEEEDDNDDEGEIGTNKATEKSTPSHSSHSAVGKSTSKNVKEQTSKSTTHDSQKSKSLHSVKARQLECELEQNDEESKSSKDGEKIILFKKTSNNLLHKTNESEDIRRRSASVGSIPSSVSLRRGENKTRVKSSCVKGNRTNQNSKTTLTTSKQSLRRSSGDSNDASYLSTTSSANPLRRRSFGAYGEKIKRPYKSILKKTNHPNLVLKNWLWASDDEEDDDDDELTKTDRSHSLPDSPEYQADEETSLDPATKYKSDKMFHSDESQNICRGIEEKIYLGEHKLDDTNYGTVSVICNDDIMFGEKTFSKNDNNDNINIVIEEVDSQHQDDNPLSNTTPKFTCSKEFMEAFSDL